MPSLSVDCLYTTVKNTSGSERYFGFLGERGLRLDADESVTVRGNLVSKLGAMTSKRRFASLEKALYTDNSLLILSTPAQHLYDLVDDTPKILQLSNGTIQVVDPCYYSSSVAA